MKINRPLKKVHILAFLLLSLLSVLSLHAQEIEPAPYLYYYSNIVNGFVIERADGTDSRIIAQDVIPKSHNEIYEPMWSPSGKWLAWRSADYVGLGPSDYSGWIISSDGATRLTLLDRETDAKATIRVMEWASEQDLLFVTDVTVNEQRDGSLIRYLLIDVEAGIIRTSYEVPLPYVVPDPTVYFWLPNGLGVSINTNNLFAFNQTDKLYFVTLRADGQKHFGEYTPSKFLSYSSEGRLTHITLNLQHLPVFDSLDFIESNREIFNYPSPDNVHIGMTSSHAILNNFTGITEDFSIHSAAIYATNIPAYYDWHPDGLWVLVTTDATFAGCCGATAMLVLNHADSATSRRELNAIWGFGASWLPERVIPHLATAQAQSVLQQPTLTQVYDTTVTGLTWSPDGSEIAVYDNSGQLNFTQFSGTLTETSSSVINKYTLEHQCPSNPIPCPMDWKGETITIGDYLFDRTRLSTTVVTTRNHLQELANLISEDGRWSANINRKIIQVIHTVDGTIADTMETEYGVLDIVWRDNRLIILTEIGIYLFDEGKFSTQSLISARTQGYSDKFYAMSVSPDGRLVAGGSIYSRIHIWSLETGELLTVLNWYALAINFSPDGRWLAAGNGNLVTFWDMVGY